MKKFLLMTSFLLLFCFNSTVCAYTDLNNDEAEYIFKYLFTDEYYSNRNTAISQSYTSGAKINFNETALDSFITYFNQNNTLDLNNNNTIYIVRYGNSNSFSVYYANFNNTFSSTYPFLRFNKTGTYTGTITAVDSIEDLNSINIQLHVIDGKLDLVNNSINYTNYRTTQIGTGFEFYINIPSDWYKDTNTDVLNPIPGVCSLSPNTSIIYSNLLSDGTTVNPPASVFLSTFYEFADTPEIPDNPEDPDNPGSGESGSVDLSGIQTGINNINNNLNNIENKIPTSGDITQSTQTGIVSGNQEFWGSSGDLTGEQQEDLISDKIDDLTNSLSGDLAENEIFGILQTYEDKLFGGFTGQEDFVISWNDINYNGQKLIPSGEVNFSKICRENEALGKVKSTINIILTFIILMNIVIYMYNLLLATLGIDNPYLYEKPVGSVTTSEYTDESGRTYVTRTQHDGHCNSISKRYNHTVEPKRRQIGFRKW